MSAAEAGGTRLHLWHPVRIVAAMTGLLYHITTVSAAERADAAGNYRHQSLEAEGFIHLSTLDQLLIPANERYAGRQDLVVLVIDRSSLSDDLVFEDSYGSGIEFPHLYRHLDWSSVVEVVEFPCGEDGRFTLPPSLAKPEN